MDQFATSIQDFLHPLTTDNKSKAFIKVIHKPDALELGHQVYSGI